MWADLLRSRSVFSVFSDSELKAINFNRYVKRIDGEVCLEPEGAISKHLFIALDETLLLYSNEGSENLWIGSVGKGRSANLFTFLRGLPSRFSVHVKGPATVIQIPRPVLEGLFQANPSAKDYFLKTTESGSYRYLAGELRALELSSTFMVRFIAQAGLVRASQNEKILETGRVPSGPIFLSEGQFLLRNRTAAQIPWNVPQRVWVGWKEAMSEEPSRTSIHSVRSSEYIQISRVALVQLKKEFPKDYDIFEKWIVGGILPQIRDDDDESIEVEEDELENIFREADDEAYHRSSPPFVMQHSQMDCAPACMAMISLYFGKDLSVQFWRSKLSTGREGTSLYDLAESAEKFGFITQCLAFDELDDLEDYMFPFIALRNSHYVVVYEVGEDSVTIGDPSRSVLKMSLKEFYVGEEQYGLFLKPNAHFSENVETQSRWKHYFYLFNGTRKDVLLALGCGLAAGLLTMVIPVVTQMMIDDVVRDGKSNLLVLLLCVSVGMIAVSVVATWSKFYFFNAVVARFNFRATNAFVQKMFKLPYQFFALRHVGDFTQRINELAQLRSFLTGTLFEIAMNAMMLLIYAIALFIASPWIALVAIVLAGAMLVAPGLFASRMSRMFTQLSELRAAQSSRITDFVNGIATIKSNRAEDALKSKFSRELGHLVDFENKFYMTSSGVVVITGGLYQFANIVVVGACGYLAIQGHLSAGEIVFVILIASRFFGPALMIGKEWDRFVQARSAMERLNDVFLAPSEQINSTGGNTSTANFKGEIEFREVWFRYGGENAEWVLRDVSFKINPAEQLAIVGASGSGKSTIACLIARIYEPTKGSILIDGRDYREYDIDFLRTQIGLLHQEPSLFAGSILANIGLNEMEPDIERARHAAERAMVLPTITSKPSGFGYPIPHGGLGFSKGEKQRLALARLFYSEPQVMVLDEATAALDGVAEKNIMDGIAREMKERTVINIVHRYSTLLHSRSALVLSHGRIVGFGPIELLKHNNATFQQLFNLVPVGESREEAA